MRYSPQSENSAQTWTSYLLINRAKCSAHEYITFPNFMSLCRFYNLIIIILNTDILVFHLISIVPIFREATSKHICTEKIDF